MIEVIKAFGFSAFGVFLGLAYARHGWKKYYEGVRRGHDVEEKSTRGRGSR